MAELVVLDAVSVATIARAARNLCSADAEPSLEVLPEVVASAIGDRSAVDFTDDHRTHLNAYATELDEIAEAAVALDQHEHEIEHQLRWWGDRAAALEDRLTGHPGDDVDIVRELALYRGRISGATTMRRHYAEQRNALVARHRSADQRCAEALSG